VSQIASRPAFSVLSVECLNLAPTAEVYGLAYVLATRQAGGIGRRAGLRISKSSISRRFVSKNFRFTRENAILPNK